MSDFFKDKIVWITGGAGFIGSHLADAVVRFSPRQVVIIDSFITGSEKTIAHLQDRTDEGIWVVRTGVEEMQYAAYISAAEDAAQPQAPDVIFHLASPASPDWYQRYPVQTYLANVHGTHELLSFCTQFAPSARFVFASTSEIYGDPEVHPQSETYWGNVNPNGPRSCYDEAKRMGETICGVFERTFQLDVRIARIFNTYGPRIGLDDGRVIPNFVTQAVAGNKLTIYGDGSQTRSYCYVDDLVAGLLALASGDGLSGETINLGNPDEQTVLQTAQTVYAAITGEVLNEEMIEWKALPTDDPVRRRPDISKAQSLLHWEPVVSFASGIEQTAADVRARTTPIAPAG